MSESARIDVDRYLDRLALDRPEATDLTALAALQRAHLVHVPFENLDIVFAGGVAHDRRRAVDKIVSGRGGWCFETNGAFGLLLDELGYDVRLLGAAVLLGGPSTIIEHLLLEVSGGDGDLDPHLVDVGFGDSFVVPLPLNQRGPVDGETATFEFLASPQGTTLAEYVDGIPEARLRFKRVAHDFDQFEAIAASMQVDPDKHWHRKPFATRLTGNGDGDGDDRVWLNHDAFKLRRNGVVEERPVERDEWDALLDEWFAMRRPGPWPE